ncbi:MAG TPA: zinc ABC transporter permease, partial [Rhodobacteraceae bacterium]|nr:zinc ABC transporter permease [Paracoccaceae bacterium]
ALIIAIGGAATLLLVMIIRRPMMMVAFDSEYAAALGLPVHRIDLAMMGLVMAVTVVGLKIVGLILIVALLIIPAVTARFWSDRSDHVVLLSGVIGGLSGYLGAAVSASAPNLPTGPIIVLFSFGFFVVSLFLAPVRGVLAAIVRHLRFQRRVHIRQGLLALAQGQNIYESYTLRLLRQAGLARPDGVATDAGRAQAAKALRDEKRWELVRGDDAFAATAALYDGLRDIETVLTRDQIGELDRRIGGPQEVPA